METTRTVIGQFGPPCVFFYKFWNASVDCDESEDNTMYTEERLRNIFLFSNTRDLYHKMKERMSTEDCEELNLNTI